MSGNVSTAARAIASAGTAVPPVSSVSGAAITSIGQAEHDAHPVALSRAALAVLFVGAFLTALDFFSVNHPMYGAMPPAASQAFKDFGLSAFVAAVGLDSGVQALLTLKESGVTLLLLGIFITLFPMILSMLFARYVHSYRNAALLAGAMAGSRGASPAFGQVLDKSESPVATVPFAVTYALGSVLLALLGPVLIELA
nr:hypothetical protein [Burkholderia sp. Ac-20365]